MEAHLPQVTYRYDCLWPTDSARWQRGSSATPALRIKRSVAMHQRGWGGTREQTRLSRCSTGVRVRHQ